MKKIEVLIADKIAPEGLSLLKKSPRFRLHWKAGAPMKELDGILRRCDCLLVRSETKVTREVIAQAKSLKVIGRAGVGVDNIAVEAATVRGILVVNVPSGNTLAAAEHAFALMLALARNVPQADQSLKAGRWERSKWIGSELSGKALGVIGFGRIGKEVARRASAFGMKVLAYDPYVPAGHIKQLGAEPADLKGLLSSCDYVSLHASLNEKTSRILNSKTMKWLKPGARLINCARGELLEEKALLEALESGRLRGAALDVFSKEPLPSDSPLLKTANLVLTPHLGASTEESQLKVAEELSRYVLDFFEKGVVHHAVNLPGFEEELLEKLSPHLELAERLGRFTAQALEGGLSGLEVRCEGAYEPDQRHPLAVAVLKGLLSSILDVPAVNWVNAPLLAQERGIRVLESADPKAREGYSRLLTVTAKTERGSRSISGAVSPEGEMQIAALDNLPVDVVLKGKMLVIRNSDRPGMIGRVGTLLGKYQVNIADMRVGRKSPKGEAAMVITVDEEVPAELLKKLRRFPGIAGVRWVRLD